jgi:hypothetical protein
MKNMPRDVKINMPHIFAQYAGNPHNSAYMPSFIEYFSLDRRLLCGIIILTY